MMESEASGPSRNNQTAVGGSNTSAGRKTKGWPVMPRQATVETKSHAVRILDAARIRTLVAVANVGPWPAAHDREAWLDDVLERADLAPEQLDRLLGWEPGAPRTGRFWLRLFDVLRTYEPEQSAVRFA
jgi:hypothetical protein